MCTRGPATGRESTGRTSRAGPIKPPAYHRGARSPPSGKIASTTLSPATRAGRTRRGRRRPAPPGRRGQRHVLPAGDPLAARRGTPGGVRRVHQLADGAPAAAGPLLEQPDRVVVPADALVRVVLRLGQHAAGVGCSRLLSCIAVATAMTRPRRGTPISRPACTIFLALSIWAWSRPATGTIGRRGLGLALRLGLGGRPGRRRRGLALGVAGAVPRGQAAGGARVGALRPLGELAEAGRVGGAAGRRAVAAWLTRDQAEAADRAGGDAPPVRPGRASRGSAGRRGGYAGTGVGSRSGRPVVEGVSSERSAGPLGAVRVVEGAVVTHPTRLGRRKPGSPRSSGWPSPQSGPTGGRPARVDRRGRTSRTGRTAGAAAGRHRPGQEPRSLPAPAHDRLTRPFGRTAPRTDRSARQPGGVIAD